MSRVPFEFDVSPRKPRQPSAVDSKPNLPDNNVQVWMEGSLMATANFDTDAFETATDGILPFFTKKQAKALVAFRGDPILRGRIEELAAKSTEGELTQVERAEYEGYVRANKFIAVLQAKARKVLNES